MTLYVIRVRPDANGFYTASRGLVMGYPFDTREDAEEVRRAMPNGHEFEVIQHQPKDASA